MRSKLRFALALGLMFMLFSLVALTVDLLGFPYREVRRQSGTVNIEYAKQSSLQLTGIEPNDRVLVAFQTTAPVNLTVLKGSRPIPTAPFEVEGRTHVFVDYLLDTKRFLFIAPEAENYTLLFNPLTPQTPYSPLLTDDMNTSISQSVVDGHKMLNITLSSFKNVGERFPKIFLAYPLDLVVRNDFEVRGVACLTTGAIGMMTVNFVDDTDYAMYGYEVLSANTEKGQMTSFSINSTSRELFGHGSIKDDRISFMSVGIALDKLHSVFEERDIVYASVLLGDIQVSNGGKRVMIDAEASIFFEVPYQVNISSKFHPDSYVYLLQAFFVAGTALTGVAIFAGDRHKRGFMGSIS